MAQLKRHIVILFNEGDGQIGVQDLPNDQPIRIADIYNNPGHPLHDVFPWDKVLTVDEDAELSRLYQAPAFFNELTSQARRRAEDLGIADYDPPAQVEMYCRVSLAYEDRDAERDAFIVLAEETERVDQGDDHRIKITYLVPEPTFPPSAVMYTRNPFATHQEHLQPAPAGVDALAAWQRLADGSSVGFIDIEQGWLLSHDDLYKVPLTWGRNQDVVPVKGFNVPVRDHGTAMLGIVKASDNREGCVGIAPNCEAFAVSEWPDDATRDTHLALQMAIIHLSTLPPEVSIGGVILIEAQSEISGTNAPIEAHDPSLKQLMMTAALTHFLVVEPAGNGDEDVDKYLAPDSLALVVAAGMPAEQPFVARQWGRWDRSNFGTGVHCFARGDVTTSLSSVAPWYGCRTGGTSASAAIVAGAAVLLQSFMKAQGKVLSPLEIRDLLSSTHLGTRADPGTDPIGVMPDLGAILDAHDDVKNGVFAGPGNIGQILDISHTGHIPRRGSQAFRDLLAAREALRQRARESFDGVQQRFAPPAPVVPVLGPDRSPYFSAP
jgi:hypothetical protein